MKKVIAIVGPTATGKTALSLYIKENIKDITLINGDAVQVYKGLDIGSDKVSREIQEKYPHHLLDVSTLDKKYTVYDFQKDSRSIIDNSKLSLIVGGSGFYIKASLYDYRFNKNTYDKEKYNKIISKGESHVKEYILSKDPNIEIDFTNDRKKDRALIRILNKEIPSENTFEDNKVYDSLIIYLDINRDILRERVLKRIENQLERGFESEVKSLLKYKDNIKDILGYREMLLYLDNEITIDEYKERLVNKTMQLAKRQKTWFKNKMDVEVFDALDESLKEKVLERIKKFLNE